MATFCTACGTPLIYDPMSQAMLCKNCGKKIAPENIETEGREYLEDQEIISAKEAFGLKGTECYEMADFNVYSCSSCGGEIIINGTEASTYCIYCGNPSIVFSRVSRLRKPKYIMPFKITKGQAEAILRKSLSGNTLIPEKIKNFRPDMIRGIYIPYHIVSAEYKDALFMEYKEKMVKTRYHEIAGKCVFKNVPVESSSRLCDGISTKLEPYYLKDLVPFDEDYLTGFYSDMTDLSADKLNMTVKRRLHQLFFERIDKDIKGESNKFLYTNPTLNYLKEPDYAMLPVWFITFFYDNKPHTILVNGQTGKVVGAFPWDKKKYENSLMLNMILYTALISMISLPVGLLCYGNVPLFLLVFFISFFGGIFAVAQGFNYKQKTLDMIKQTQSQETMVFVKRRQG
ncbi:MAG: hypothetical protein J5685_11170 [Clostridiales bacterium]|nr:hypothetical protein [Clostridiales bacterium]